jgi:DNA-directed RNA polymerase subunit RPC12/RpoP
MAIVVRLGSRAKSSRFGADILVKAFYSTLAGLVIIGSAIWLFSYYRSQPKPGSVVAHRAPVACAACGKAYVMMLGDQPAKCHYCGEQAVWRAMMCAKCGAIVPIVKDSSSTAEAGPPRCPKCGGRLTEVPADAVHEP